MLGTGTQTLIRSHVGTDALTLAQLGTLGFGDNGLLTITESDQNSTTDITGETTLADSYIFTETGTNTGVFTTHDNLGSSDSQIVTNCAVDDYVDFAYGGTTVRLTCATSNAAASLDAGAAWMPGEAATYTITDPDMNRNSQYAETLDIEVDNLSLIHI